MPLPDDGVGLAFTRVPRRPLECYAQVDCNFLEFVDGITLQRWPGRCRFSARFLDAWALFVRKPNEWNRR
jgi:hypothetical protein